MLVDRMLELADHIEQSDSMVDLRAWSCCICGFAINKWGTWDTIEPHVDQGQRLLGLSRLQAEALFASHYGPSDDHRTAAVNRLRRMVLSEQLSQKEYRIAA